MVHNKLLHRKYLAIQNKYTQYMEVQNDRQNILFCLSNEFFLTKRSINQILKKNLSEPQIEQNSNQLKIFNL